MQQLKFDFAADPRERAPHAGPCRTCSTIGHWPTSDCGQCRREKRRRLQEPQKRQSAKRRYWTFVGRDRNGELK